MPVRSFKSRTTLRLLRLTDAKFSLYGASPAAATESGGQLRMPSPPSGRSILITSAPRSASSDPANGPAAIWPSSMTRTPASGPWLELDMD